MYLLDIKERAGFAYNLGSIADKESYTFADNC